MNPIALACLLFAGTPDDDLRQLQDLRRAHREKGTEAAALRRSAHEELDRAAYDRAVESHRRAAALEVERIALGKAGAEQVEKIASGLLKELDHDGVEARDRASRQLLLLGPGAIAVLERLLPGPSAEVQYRLTDAIAKLKRLEVDAEGRVHQWASTAGASSEYTNTGWSAMQAAGKPDTLAAGDARSAWASMSADGGEEWLELGYEHRVRPTRVRVHETYNPGAVVRIEGRDEEGAWRILWEGKDPVREGLGWLDVPVAAGFATRAIRIMLDSAGVAGWNEIDAVELIGEGS